MKIEEEIQCEYCESKFEITYNDNDVTETLSVCPFCAETLNIDYEDEDE